MNDNEATEYLRERGILRDPLDHRDLVQLAELHKATGSTALKALEEEVPVRATAESRTLSRLDRSGISGNRLPYFAS